MHNTHMSDMHFAFSLSMLITGTAGVIGVGRQAGQNAWVPLLGGLALSFLLYFFYARVESAYPGLGLFDILIRQFGQVFGKLLAGLVVLYAASRCALALRHFGEFVYITSLHKTPQLVFLLCLGVLCALAARAHREALGRIGTVLFLLVAVFGLLAFAANMPNMDVRNLLPFDPTIRPEEVADVIAFPFGDAFLLLALLGRRQGGLAPGPIGYRKYALGLCLGGGMLLLAQMHNILTLGAALTTEEYFPFYPAMSLIDLGDFFQRTEALASGTLLFGCFFKGALCVMVMAHGLSTIFGTRNPKVFAFPTALVCAGLAAFLFSSTMQMFEQAPLYKLWGLPFQVGLMLLVWLLSEIHRRRDKSRQSMPNASATG